MATLSIWKFTSPDGAEQAMRTLIRLQDDRLITVQDASVVSWPAGRPASGTPSRARTRSCSSRT